MRIDGVWQHDPADLDLVRPTIPARLVVSDQAFAVAFLVDTGADRTVLGSAFASILLPHERKSAESFVSAGGTLSHFVADARIMLVDVDGRAVSFNVPCVVLSDAEQANTHLLGRDVLDYFAVICDRERDVVTLLRPPHTYSIQG